MGAVTLIARLALAAVFAVAGWAKLTDRAGTRDAVVAFGAPGALAAPFALLIPVAELASAVLLLPAATAVAGALVALGLLVLFSVAIAVNNVRGRTPECHCFGQLHSAPAGPKTLARNGVLAAAAVLVLVGGGGPSAIAWLGRLDGTALVAMLAAAVISMLVLAGLLAFLTLLRAHGRVLRRLDRLEQAMSEAGIAVADEAGPGLEVIPPQPQPQYGLPLGSPAPALALADVGGATVSLDDLLGPRLPLMLVFASPHCGPCSALMPELGRWQHEHADRLTVAIASDGLAADVRAEAQELALRHVLLDDGASVFASFEARGTPSAVLIAADGTIASHLAGGRDAIEGLLRDVLEAPGLPVGASAPEVQLTSIGGEPATLTADTTVDTVVLFWNPDCGYCRALHGDLLAWEASVNGSGPRLVVVSSGDPGRTREDGFRSVVLLDPEFAAGEAFGAGGTPSAVLLGCDGRVASGVAVGAQAVLALTAPRSEVQAGRPAP
jgi:thiol-disulfide isomerase/thioredoxin